MQETPCGQIQGSGSRKVAGGARENGSCPRFSRFLGAASIQWLMMHLGITSCSAAEWPPMDHGGQDWELRDGDVVWGSHTNVRRFLLQEGVHVRVKPYDGDVTSGMGTFELQADSRFNVEISGVLDASGCGYSGGGGGGGARGDLSAAGCGGLGAYAGEVMVGVAGEVHVGGSGGHGDGPFGGGPGVFGSPGGYGAFGTHGEEGFDFESVWMGSGGGGQDGLKNGDGGDSGGRGGGAIKIFGGVIVVYGAILANGTHGSQGFAATELVGGCGANSTSDGNGTRGGGGSGGGILLSGVNQVSLRGKVESLGAGNLRSNGGSLKVISGGVIPFSGQFGGELVQVGRFILRGPQGDATVWPQGDYQGACMALTGQNYAFGKYVGIDTFEILPEADLIIAYYGGAMFEDPTAGSFTLEAESIRISGTLNAVGAGYSGGGGSPGSGGAVIDLEPGWHNATQSYLCLIAGYTRYNSPPPLGFCLPSGGDGPFGAPVLLGEEEPDHFSRKVVSLADGGYRGSGINGDESVDESVWMGSGGRGGARAANSDPIEPGDLLPTAGEGAGGGGGAGGGRVELRAASVLEISGDVLANGITGGDASDGVTSHTSTVCWPPNPPISPGECHQVLNQGAGGRGGEANWDTMGNGLGSRGVRSLDIRGEDGGAGAGGGVLLKCETPGGMSISGTVNVLGGRDQLENGGTIKVFYAGGGNPVDGANMLTPRLYKKRTDLGDLNADAWMMH